jgi:hypothetical protein
MTLTTILEQINEQKNIAQQDLDTVSPRALPYKKGQVESAKAKLEGLYIDYKNELLKNSVFILVTGNESESFAKIAEDNFKCFSVDGKVFYRDILEQISPHLYKNKQVNASVFEAIGNVLETKLKNLDIMSYNQLMFDAKYSKVVKDDVEMLDVIVDSINNIVGSEVVGLDALERVTTKAIEKNYKSKIVPILLHTQDETLVRTLSEGLRRINPKVVSISAGKTESDLSLKIALEEVTKKKVEETLKTIAANA